MSRDEPPFEHEPRSDREWKLLFEYRLKRVEDGLANLNKTILSILGLVIAGVIVYLITTGGPTGGTP